jgi:GxxExxY protein
MIGDWGESGEGVDDALTRAILDLLVEGTVIVEVKVVEALSKVHYSQVLSYLRATGLSVALLVNFDHPKADYRRVVSPPSPIIPPIS